MGDVTVAQEALPVSPAVTDEGWSRLRYADRIYQTRRLALLCWTSVASVFESIRALDVAYCDLRKLTITSRLYSNPIVSRMRS